jgi:PAS domain S-box-containing protein
MRPGISPTGVERFFKEDEIIVSKTDPKGIITYANPVFLSIALYEEEEVLGQAHNIIRHPDMPQCIFDLLWKTIASGEEIFAYVKNMAKNGDHYWVFAHVTPTFDAASRITGYHSNRRVPDRTAVSTVDALYRKLLAEECRHGNWREGMAAGARMVESTLAEAKLSYEEFAFAIK